MKKSLSLILSIILLFSAFAPALAASTEIPPAEESTQVTGEASAEEPPAEEPPAEEPTAEEPSALPVIIPKPASGDADCSGKLNAADARLAIRAAVGLATLPDYAAKAADMDADGKVTAADARIILRLAVGLPKIYVPAPKPEPKPDFFTPALTEKDVPVGAKVIYLTFDDGPSANTGKILDILKRYNVKATFFVIKNETYAYNYKRIVEEGHSIALHSYTHDYSAIYRSEDAYFNDLNNISDYVFEKTGVRTRMIRFPGGSSNTVSRSYCRGIMSRLAVLTAEKGYVYYDWNSANNDATGRNLSVAQIRNAADSYGGRTPLVMLMHDAAAKGKTVEALPGIIEYYKGLGYYFLPLNENSTTAHHGIAN